MVRAQHLELGDELGVIAQEQLRLDASLDGGEPKLVEAVRLELEGEAPGDVGERVPPPQCETPTAELSAASTGLGSTRGKAAATASSKRRLSTRPESMSRR